MIAFDAEVSSLLREAEEWHVIARLLERPRPAWRADIWRLIDSTMDDELREIALLSRGASEGRYLAAFGPSGVVSPREVAHCGLRDPGQLLAEIEAAYRAFGYAPAREDTADHVSVEAGFVGYLRLKEAYARVEGHAERAHTTAQAAQWFIDEHLRDMAHPMAQKLRGVAEPYLARAVQALAARVGESPGAAPAKVVWLEDESWECGETGAG